MPASCDACGLRGHRTEARGLEDAVRCRRSHRCLSRTCDPVRGARTSSALRKTIMSKADPSGAAQIRGHVQRLLDEAASFDEQRNAARALFEDLCAQVGIDPLDPDAADEEQSSLPAGDAISPLDAARCVNDFARTRAFIRGVVQAVSAARRRLDQGPVRVIYAGCGPFAPLFLPIAHLWAPDEVRVLLLDCHRRSLDAARRVAELLEVEDRVEGFVQTDAVTYQCESDWRPHVCIVETMQRALAKEPQVSIVSNLAGQMAPGGLMVPEQIELHLALLNIERELAGQGPAGRRELGCVMRLSGAGASCTEVVWPDDVPNGLEPCICTRIRVFGDIWLSDHESGLTTPMPLWDLPGIRPGQTIRFDYELTPRPHLVYEPI